MNNNKDSDQDITNKKEELAARTGSFKHTIRGTENTRSSNFEENKHENGIVHKNPPRSYEIHRPEKVVYKYSNKDRSVLQEAVLLDGEAVFISYENGEIKATNRINSSNRILRPPHREEYPYDPYEFSSMENLKVFVDRVKRETAASLYQKAKFLVSMYNDQDEEIIILIASDVVWSYFQDRFGTTHYIEIVGDNGSGKSTIGHTFESIGYRPINMTDPSAANLFRALGTVEAGQCTIIADEADNMSNSPQLMSILKNGYQIRGRVFKINMNTQNQESFYAYCYKLIICEQSLKHGSAAGMLDRTFTVKTFKGKPKFDIKESLNPGGDKNRLQRIEELIDLRKMMLVYRLIHFQDPIEDIEIELDGRDRELCKPMLQLFHRTAAEKEIEVTLRKFLSEKNAEKQNTIEYALYPIVVNLVNYGKVVYVKQVWSELIHNIQGIYDEERKPNDFQTYDFGVIHRNTVSKLICDKFGARGGHRKDGNVLVFDLNKLVKAGQVYDFENGFQSKLHITTDKITEGCEDGESSEGNKDIRADIVRHRWTNGTHPKSNLIKMPDQELIQEAVYSNGQNGSKIESDENEIGNPKDKTSLSSH
jgi:hypothetical protein